MRNVFSRGREPCPLAAVRVFVGMLPGQQPRRSSPVQFGADPARAGARRTVDSFRTKCLRELQKIQRSGGENVDRPRPVPASDKGILLTAGRPIGPAFTGVAGGIASVAAKFVRRGACPAPRRVRGFHYKASTENGAPHTRGWAPIPTSGCQVPDPVSARSPYPAAFVREYRLDLNATQAAIRAGYSPKTACIIGHENLTKPNIKAMLAESEAKALAKADLSAQNVLEAIRRHLMRDVRQLVGEDGTFKPLHELTPDQIEMIDKITEDADGTVTYRIESLLKWVEMAAKHFSLSSGSPRSAATSSRTSPWLSRSRVRLVGRGLSRACPPRDELDQRRPRPARAAAPARARWRPGGCAPSGA